MSIGPVDGGPAGSPVFGSIDRVHLELVVDGAGEATPGRRGDVVVAVDAAEGTTFGAVRRELAEAAGCDPGPFWCGDRWLTDDDVLGLPPLLHGATLRSPAVGRGPGHTSATRPPGALVLAVRSGPVCGDLRVLPPGEHRVGRAPEADVVVDDVEVSRLHAVVAVGPPGAPTVVRDLGSTNGTLVDGRRVGSSGQPVDAGTRVLVGSSTMTLEPAPGSPGIVPASCRPDGSGRLLLNRPPRPAGLPPETTVAWPEEPVGRAKTRLSVLALAVPLVGGVVLAAVTRTPGFLVFAALSPLMLVGTWAGDLVTGRRSARESRREHARALAAAQARVAAAVSAEESWWRSTCPDLASLLLSVTTPRSDIWCRRPGRPDFLLCRLGLGDRPARVTTTGRAPPDAPRLSQVPVAVSLADAGVLGVAGARARLLSTVRALVAQVSGWQSPSDVSLAVVSATGDADWTWTRWLPHLTTVGPAKAGPGTTARDTVTELVSILDRRRAGRGAGTGDATPAVVIVLDGAESLRHVPGVRRLLVDGPAVGLVSICCDRDLVALPAECTVTLDLGSGRGPAARLVDAGATTSTLLAEGVSSDWARRFAEAVAPLRDSSGEGGGFGDVRLGDLCDVDVHEPSAVAAGWRRRPAGTEVPIGVGADGRPVLVDLARDGPHALVAGTTGSGKSELLQTLVCGLAVTNRPDRLSFVLVDYKGGAAFREAARLPHTVGVVTDLDGPLSARALRSMEAEVRRREVALRDAACVDFATYEATSADPMPRLVLVVDEYAALAEELPEFVGGLVAIAQRGRSLGIHLVLATQRPAGVVSADIKANTNLRVALRVLDPVESVDVVDCRDAAAIPATAAGRAVLRAGNEPAVHLRVARVSGSARSGGPAARVRLVTDGSAPPPDEQPTAQPGIRSAGPREAQSVVAPKGGSAGGCPTDQRLLVDAVRAAAGMLGTGSSRSPWLPPLPTVVSVEQLPGTPPGEAPVGLVDRPDEQARRALTLGLDGGHHLLVVGGPRSGRTTALRLAAQQLAVRHAPDRLHIHALDPGGGLADLAALPHCGTVAGRDDPARAVRLLELLLDELDRRRRRPVLPATAAPGPVEAGRRHPWVLLLVDDWEAVVDALEEVDHGRAAGLLDRLVREGGSGGFRVVAAGGRRALTGRLASSVPDRVVLRLSDPTDYALAGVASRDVPAEMPPGRGLLLPGGHEVQLARPSRLPEAATAGLTDAAAAGLPETAAAGLPETAAAGLPETAAVGGPLRLRALPARTGLAEALVGAKAAAAGPGWTLVGLGGDEASAVGVDLMTAGPGMLVAGPPGSGRSTALVAMARWLVQEGQPLAVVSHPRSPLHELGGQAGCVLLTTDDDHLVRELAGAMHGLTVLVDDVEAIADTAVERALQDLVRPGATSAVPVVVSGTAAELAASYRGLAVDVRRSRTGLFLGPPGPADGDLLGARLPPTMTTPGPPGRGVLVVRGRPLLVQVPADDA